MSTRKKTENSISFLLGAGFSAPIGYPIGNKLNELILNCTGDQFSFSSGGNLAVSTDNTKPNFGYRNSYDFTFDFLIDLIRYFEKDVGYFDYEEFFDFISTDLLKIEFVKSIAEKHVAEVIDTYGLINGLKNVYTQVVSYYLKDAHNKRYYDDEAYNLKPYFPGYTGILNCIEKYSEDHILNIHTLNHDLYLERLNNTEWLKVELCDGFSEIGSPYYGRLTHEGRAYNVRLERYTGEYSTKMRLFKLHGSRDYGVYYSAMGSSTATPDSYVKSRYGIGWGELYKEVEIKGKMQYENCWINYHADFLTGTTSKITRYKEPLLYKILFDKFISNLKEAQQLIIIGYGGKDSEINKLLIENFDFKNRRCVIVDPYPGEKVKDLAHQLNAKIVSRDLDSIKPEDL